MQNKRRRINTKVAVLCLRLGGPRVFASFLIVRLGVIRVAGLNGVETLYPIDCGHLCLAVIEALGVGIEAGFDHLLLEVRQASKLLGGALSPGLGFPNSCFSCGDFLPGPGLGSPGPTLHLFDSGLGVPDSGGSLYPPMFGLQRCHLHQGHPLVGLLGDPRCLLDPPLGGIGAGHYRISSALGLAKLIDQLPSLILGPLQGSLDHHQLCLSCSGTGMGEHHLCLGLPTSVHPSILVHFGHKELAAEVVLTGLSLL